MKWEGSRLVPAGSLWEDQRDSQGTADRKESEGKVGGKVRIQDDTLWASAQANPSLQCPPPSGIWL